MILAPRVVHAVCFSWAWVLSLEFQPPIHGYVLYLVRTLQLVRFLYIIDSLGYAMELHLLITSILGCLRFVVWAVLMTLVPIFMFGVILTKAVSDFRIRVTDGSESAAEMDDLLYFFGNLGCSMLTLFYSISGGLSWHEALVPLNANNFHWLSNFYVLYVATTLFAILNVLAGVFVNSAIAATSAEVKKQSIDELRRLFRSADQDNSGMLDYREFEESVLSNGDFNHCLESLDIRADHAKLLFHLLDKDRSGEIECEEFVSGCIKLHGSATAIDFASFLDKWAEHQQQVDEHMRFMNMHARRMDDFVKGGRVLPAGAKF